MIVAIDVGNTCVKAALFDRGTIVAREVADTAACTSPQPVERLIRSLCARLPRFGMAPYVAVASVVPELEPHVEQALMAVQRYIMLPAIFVTPERELGIEIAVSQPEKLGADRIAAAVAAVETYGCPVIVISCGSAVTLTVVDAGRRLLGGAIAPGPTLAAKALATFTARLPLVEVSDDVGVPPIIGRQTEQAIRAGIFHSFVGTVEAFVRRARAVLGDDVPAVLTGGFADAAAAVLGCQATIHRELTLHGIRYIALRNGASD